MILDASAVVAIFLKEPGFDGVVEKLASASDAGIGTPTLAGDCLAYAIARPAPRPLLCTAEDFAKTDLTLA